MSAQSKPSIVFCHGLWADGSCFSKVIPPLQAEGHQVIAAQYGLDTPEGDVATVIRTLGRVDSPAILVGHSYGGSVITAAGTDDRVAGLVYIAALAPDADETSQSLQDKFPTTDVFAHIEVADGRIWLLPDGIDCFAGDLPEAEQAARLGDPIRTRRRPVRPQRRGRRVAVEAQLVHPGHAATAPSTRTSSASSPSAWAPRPTTSTAATSRCSPTPTVVLDVIRTAASAVQGSAAAAAV